MHMANQDLHLVQSRITLVHNLQQDDSRILPLPLQSQLAYIKRRYIRIWSYELNLTHHKSRESP
jgi:hypothetical protein